MRWGVGSRGLALARSLAEHGWQLLMRGLAATGRRAEAVRAFHSCRSALRRDLGLDAGPATVRLFEQVLTDPPAGSRGAGPRVVGL